MKKMLCLTVTCCIVLFLLNSCDNNIKNPVVPTGLTKMKDTISLSTYNTWESAWKEKGRGFMNTDSLFYFTMPLIDLSEFATLNHAAARYIIGLDTTQSPAEPHLMLVGVNSAGESILPSKKNPRAKIFDVTKPCPKYCGGNGLPK